MDHLRATESPQIVLILCSQGIVRLEKLYISTTAILELKFMPKLNTLNLYNKIEDSKEIQTTSPDNKDASNQTFDC